MAWVPWPPSPPTPLPLRGRGEDLRISVFIQRRFSSRLRVFASSRLRVFASSRLRVFASSRLRVSYCTGARYRDAAVMFDSQRPRVCSLWHGSWPPHPRPLSPCGGEGSICGFQSSFRGVFLRVFASSRELLHWCAVQRRCGHVRLSTSSHLLSMAWVPWPPHPRPLSPCGGEGRIGGFPWRK
ncbi:MAG TPA: hypothetical protein DC058_09705 [Planctomycetaceae bacterium]|nr:hypothetical protein [Planctomycetaceae bacterium]